MYIIVHGLCDLVCTNTSNKFKNLELNDDPTRAKRDAELK